MNCSAVACKRSRSRSAPFCAKHLKEVPKKDQRRLGDLDVLRDYVIDIAVKEGYLTRQIIKRAAITERQDREEDLGPEDY